jgi:hypothetical protein
MPLDRDAALPENLAAELLGVSVRTLQAWRLRGVGPPYAKLLGSRAIRYRRSDLIQFLEKSIVQSAAIPPRMARGRL